MSIGGPPDELHQDEAITAAVSMARKFVEDHRSIGESDFDQLKRHFSDREISALVAFMAFMAAAHKFGTVMDVNPQEAGS